MEPRPITYRDLQILQAIKEEQDELEGLFEESDQSESGGEEESEEQEQNKEQ